MSCLMQRPSMRVDSREPISWASVGVTYLPKKPATRGASAASTACRDMASYSGTRMSRLSTRIEGRCIKHYMGAAGVKVYDK